MAAKATPGNTKRGTTKRIATAKPTPANPMLVAQLFTLREHLRTPEEIAKTLKRVRKIGYPAVQISGMGPIDPVELKALLDDADLLAVGAHIPLAQMQENLPDVIQRLKTWDCPYVAIPSLNAAEYPTAAAWKALAKSWNPIGRKLAAEGIVLQYHNHAFEFERFGTKLGLEIIYDETDPACLQAELDVHWIARGGCNPVNWILRVAGRMDQVHLKDLVILGNEPETAEVGAGNLDWDAILPALRKAKVKYYLVEQDRYPVTQDPFRSLTMSYKFLMKKLGR